MSASDLYNLDTTEGMFEEIPRNKKSTADLNVDSNNLLNAVKSYFRIMRFDENHHLGLGDIRLTIGQQEIILQMIASATGKKFEGV